jgi:Tol biopolymer transport system component
MRISRVDRVLLAIVVILGLSVLLTGGLAVYLTLARPDDEDSLATEGMEPTITAIATCEPRIAFVSDAEGDPAIYVMDADGSNRQRISSEDQAFSLFPTWSPDGRRVAFLELSEATGAGVWVTELDGSTPWSVSQPVSDAPSWGIDAIAPVWSLDGAQVAFVSRGDSADTALQFARTDGSGIDHTIPLTGYVAVALRRSSAGERFLVVGPHGGGEGNVYTLSARSEGLTLIMTGTTAADWSPGGERIAVAERASKSVVVIESGEEPRSVVQFPTTPIDVRWSPDGRLMAVVAAGSARQGYGDALYVVDVESEETTPLVAGEAWVLWPEWSADGEHLLFTRGPLIRRSGLPYGNLWVYDVASGDMDQLTAGQGFDGLGTWSP